MENLAMKIEQNKKCSGANFERKQILNGNNKEIIRK